jgi:ribonucleoside-diphosphate reductase subunit M1
MISKKSGGIGIHIHNLRPDGSIIHSTGFPTTGVIPYLKVLNDTALHVS